MFVRQLNYLVALARERHFARAAEACHVSQPTLSAAIHHHEEELGVSIVKRGQRFEGFTTEGERVLSWAQRILADWDGLRQDVRGMRGQPVGELRCGTIPTALPVAALLNGPCRERYPLITPIVLSLPSVDIVRGIESFELEVGLSYLDDEHRPHLRELPLYRERYVLVTKDASRATPNGRIGWAEAATMPLCLLTSNMQNRQIIDAAFQQAGEPPRVTAETDSILAMYASVCYGGLA
jgi:DNA-binding transcriptional LysR family regulator